MNDRLLRIDTEIDVKIIEDHWETIKAYKEYIIQSLFTYNIEVNGCQIEDSQFNIVPLRLGDILTLQEKFRAILPTIFQPEIVFYKLKRIETSNTGLLFAFGNQGQHYIYFVDNLNLMFGELFPIVGYEGIKHNFEFTGDYMVKSSATLLDFLESVTYNKSLAQVVCDNYIKLDGLPLSSKSSYIIPLPNGKYKIDLIDHIDWVKLKELLKAEEGESVGHFH